MARRDHEEWRQLVTEWGHGGLTAAEFARRRGLSPRPLVWWRWRLRREEQRALELLPMRVVAADAPVAAAPTVRGPAASLKVGLPGGIRLRFTPEVDAGVARDCDERTGHARVWRLAFRVLQGDERYAAMQADEFERNVDLRA